MRVTFHLFRGKVNSQKLNALLATENLVEKLLRAILKFARKKLKMLKKIKHLER